MKPNVDILLLKRPHTQVPQAVLQAIHQQRGVNIQLHQAVGNPLASDPSRWATIARGRNELKQHGHAPYVMFVDDDVALDLDCVRTLLEDLQASPTLAAIAADYDHQASRLPWTGHVSMGACMFRRSALMRVMFRSTDSMCECGCCCEDLRRDNLGITYSRRAKAFHLRKRDQPRSLGNAMPAAVAKPVVMAAFDRRDIGRFEDSFLRSLRTWKNPERVIAVVYGAYPSEISRLQQLSGVSVVARPFNGETAPVRRLTDFAQVCRQLPSGTPTAYWDVADVIFQTSLSRLWQQVYRRPDRLIAVSEPRGYPENRVILPWSLTIRDPKHRQHALHLLQRNRFLNSGFAAGTAETMGRYFETAAGYLRGPELLGTTDWGDQMCLNLYCHSQPHRWHEPDRGWNYCVHDRPADEIAVSPNGLVISRKLGLIPVVHGNARSLRQFSLLIG